MRVLIIQANNFIIHGDEERAAADGLVRGALPPGLLAPGRGGRVRVAPQFDFAVTVP